MGVHACADRGGSFTVGAGLFLPVSNRLCDCKSARYAACRAAYAPTGLLSLNRVNARGSGKRCRSPSEMQRQTVAAACGDLQCGVLEAVIRRR